MGILDRFAEIMKANINALLDKAEDPEKMVDQTLRNLREDLAKVKQATAEVMAEETAAKREVDECDADIARMDAAARKALLAGSEDDARVLLGQKATLTSKREGLEKSYEVIHANAEKTRQMHDKLVADIKLCEARADTIKAKQAAAKAQERVNAATSNVSAASSLEAFDRLEAQANKRLDAAAAMAELNVKTDTADADELAAKYTTGAAGVDAELEALKAEMGLA